MSDWFKVIAYMQLSKIITVHAQLGYFQTQKLQITPYTYLKLSGGPHI